MDRSFLLQTNFLSYLIACACDIEAAVFPEQAPTLGQRRQFRIPLAMIYFGLAYVHLRNGRTPKVIQYAQQFCTFVNGEEITQEQREGDNSLAPSKPAQQLYEQLLCEIENPANNLERFE
ncbi:MAG: hypothetical protein GY796_21150 [Chloroflexi bacterium]|nr:hypothetical protein [Chloroflexota bacterium]